MVIKRSPGGQACRWRAVNFEIHLWSSGKNAGCIFGDRSASSMSKWRPAWTLTPEMIPFGTKSVTLSMLIDLLTSTMSSRSTQVKMASTDLWPQEMFTFSEMLVLVESESSFGAYVCHRRPGGSQRLAILLGSGLETGHPDQGPALFIQLCYAENSEARSSCHRLQFSCRLFLQESFFSDGSWILR